MRSLIIVRAQVVGFHAWPSAFDACSWLRNRHRHVFYIEARAQVSHDDREIEFCLLKERVVKHLQKQFGSPCEFGEMSCEMISKYILESFPSMTSVAVFEDNENGAIVKK